jgi:hypothetical protein
MLWIMRMPYREPIHVTIPAITREASQVHVLRFDVNPWQNHSVTFQPLALQGYRKSAIVPPGS